jgi:uncharacterized repeat protein (TIGR02543 family)
MQNGYRNKNEGAVMKKLLSLTLIMAAMYLSGCPLEKEYVPEFIVTFDLCGGNSYGDTALIRIPVYEATTIAYLPSPQKAGNDFGGWFTEENGQGDVFTNATHVFSNLVVYAHWIKYRKYLL